MAGPSTKPTPNAAPSIPINRGRSASGARSATAAWATDRLPPEAPSMMRPANSSHRTPAAPVTKLPTAVPTSEMTITGLRPMRSDNRPSNGAHSSWASENDAKRNPTVRPEAPKRSA